MAITPIRTVDRLALLSGTPKLLGIVVATTTKNNHDTATPFNNTADALKGKTLSIQPDAACYVLPGLLNTSTVTTGTGLKLAADQIVSFVMGEDYGWIACVSVTGTTNLKVWEMV